MNISGDTLITVYTDAAAFMLALGLLGLSRRIRKRRSEEYRLFFYMSVHLAAGCIVSFVHYVSPVLLPAGGTTFYLISETALEMIILQLAYLWVLYVDFKLYKGTINVKRRYIYILISAIIIFLLLIINLFTGIVFTISDDMHFKPTFLYYIIRITYLLFFVNSVFMVKRYDRKSGRIRFFRVTPVIISVLTGTLLHYISRCDCEMMGYAVGITLLYFSMDNELLYEDHESGFYNLAYMTYIFSLAARNKCDYHSALQLELKGNVPAGLEILGRELADAGDVIRVEQDRFLVFSGKDSRARQLFLSSTIEESVDRFNEQHPDDPIQIRAYSYIREDGQDELEFMKEAVQNKGKRDSLQSVVTMMSELDRLDDELRLAADIQISMLPMNFPPFPDRHEFELYASMDPAREVGGDFYDFFLIDQDHLALVISDVSGKGIPAALFMMVSKTMIKNNLMSGCSPAETLTTVNDQLCERNASSMFVTVWLAVLEISTGRGIAGNAGHENPALRRKDEPFVMVKYRHDLVCGSMESIQYHEHEFSLSPGDCLFVYTDGVVEATDAQNMQFGDERLIAELNRDPERNPEQLICGVREAMDIFVNGAEQFDDITMLCLKYYGPSHL